MFVFGSRVVKTLTHSDLLRPEKACTQDLECEMGSHCSSRKVCIEYDSEYCDSNSCGLGDGGSFCCMHL